MVTYNNSGVLPFFGKDYLSIHNGKYAGFLPDQRFHTSAEMESCTGCVPLPASLTEGRSNVLGPVQYKVLSGDAISSWGIECFNMHGACGCLKWMDIMMHRGSSFQAVGTFELLMHCSCGMIRSPTDELTCNLPGSRELVKLGSWQWPRPSQRAHHLQTLPSETNDSLSVISADFRKCAGVDNSPRRSIIIPHIAYDFRGVHAGMMHDGRIIQTDKAAELQMLQDGLVCETLTFNGEEIRMASSNVAIVYSNETWSSSTACGMYIRMDVWVRRSFTWQLLVATDFSTLCDCGLIGTVLRTYADSCAAYGIWPRSSQSEELPSHGARLPLSSLLLLTTCLWAFTRSRLLML